MQEPDGETDLLRRQFEAALLSIDRVRTGEILREALSLLDTPGAIEGVVVPAFENIGAGWEKGEISLSQVYMSGRICEELVDDILPPESKQRKQQPVLAVAVLQDYHFLGKRILYATVRAAGWAVRDYGHVTVEEAVRHVEQDKVDILMISVLMLPSALLVTKLTTALRALPRPVKIIVGGAPFRFDEKLWREVGADAAAHTATEVLPLIKAFADDGKERGQRDE